MRGRGLFGGLAAVAGPALATAIGLLGSLTGVAAASLCMVAVVGAAAYGGLWSGLAAALFSFLGLNFFFTHPRHTLSVGRLEDLIALLVFLAVAVIVGTLFARILAERERAERREQESVLLNRFTTALLSARSVRSVLEEFATMAVHRFELSRLVVDVDGVETVRSTGPVGPEGELLAIPVGAGDVAFGVISAVSSAERELDRADRGLLEALAAQIGVALERSRLDAVARQARTDAEMSQVRAALFSSVTHDLRTPLASIKASVTSLLDSWVQHDESQRTELLETMLEETDRLNRLVGNLLNLARARAGGLILEKELTPFEDIIESVLTRMRRALSAFQLRTLIRTDLPAIWVDPIEMDQAVTNILENAMHHSPPGDEITVSAAPWGGGVQVRISDRGPGIPAEERERVFEAFYRRQADRSGTGTGLGLAIARAVVVAHGGRIRIEGMPGQGTSVVIELPQGQPSAAEVAG
ncbi:MAG TPA: ATP-binding protein [Actinomycetota bacterium]|nr:ATP-binding protein [Actinomycetota bacterium]